MIARISMNGLFLVFNIRLWGKKCGKNKPKPAYLLAFVSSQSFKNLEIRL